MRKIPLICGPILRAVYPGEYALHLVPVVGESELLPKEQWLVDYCPVEQQKHRKVLLYVRQTGTRDIQPRLRQIFQDAGIATAPFNRFHFVSDLRSRAQVEGESVGVVLLTFVHFIL